MTAEQWEPEFEGQRPPFAPGNTVAVGNRGPLATGAYSPRTVEPRAQQLVQALLDLAGQDQAPAYLLDRTYRPALWRWALAEVRADQFSAALVDHGDCLLGCKRCQAWDAGWQKWSSIAERAAARLGLTPDARGRLGRDTAQAAAASALAAVQERGRALVAQYAPPAVSGPSEAAPGAPGGAS